MKKGLFIAALFGAAICSSLHAEEPKGNGLDLTGDVEAAPAQPRDSRVTEDGQADWFVDMDYSGYDFQLPAGLLVDKGSSFVAKSQDGTFGLSMSNESRYGSNQKIAFEICRRLAKELKLPNPVVEKTSFGKCKGAKATDTMDGMKITVLVLPYDNEQVTVVVFNTPDRQPWTDAFLRSLKR